jgi:prephenate dehydrogenase
MDTLHVGIVGLGRVGCALARALRSIDEQQLRVLVSGDDISDDRCVGALGQGFIDKTKLDPECDVVFICTPVERTQEAIERAHEQLAGSALMASTASTQERAAQEMRVHAERLGHRWMLAHPMAADNLHGAQWAVDRIEPTLEQLIERTGGHARRIDARDHDRMVALTSHLPRLVARLGMQMAELQTSDDAELVSGPGWERFTHGAHEQEELWDEIFAANAAHVAAQARELAVRLLTAADELDPPVGSLLRRLQTHK